MKKRFSEGGYAGLIAILLVSALVAVWYFRTDLFEGKDAAERAAIDQDIGVATQTPSSTSYGQARAEVDAAKAVGAKMSGESEAVNAFLEE